MASNALARGRLPRPTPDVRSGGVSESKVNPPEEDASPTGAGLVWAWVRHPVVAGIISTVIAALILLWVFGIGQKDNGTVVTGPNGDQTVVEEAKNATEEAATQPFWTAPPNLIADAHKNFSFEGDGLGPYIAEVAAVDPYSGEPRVYPPRQLVEEASQLAGLPILLVGLVENSQSIAGRYIDQEVHLVGAAKSFDAYVGTDDIASVSRGDLTIALGRVAAVGQSKDLSGSGRRTAYFLSLLNDNGGGIRSLSLLGFPASGPVWRAARAVCGESRRGDCQYVPRR
jgi:hypothetical protein